MSIHVASGPGESRVQSEPGRGGGTPPRVSNRNPRTRPCWRRAEHQLLQGLTTSLNVSRRRVPCPVWSAVLCKDYTYYVYPIGSHMPDEKGNYIYAKEQGQYWKPVYIGQGNLKDRSDTDSHHKGDCIKGNGATHFHAHLNPGQLSREAEEKDLLNNYNTPCNG